MEHIESIAEAIGTAAAVIFFFLVVSDCHVKEKCLATGHTAEACADIGIF